MHTLAQNSFDIAVNTFFIGLRNPGGIAFFKIFTQLGNWQIVVPLALILSYALYRKRMNEYVFALWVTLVTSEALAYVMKILIHRPRPLAALLTETDFSFPSGHATIAMAFYGFMILFVIRSMISTQKKKVLIVLFSILIFTIGFSRLYLGVHYLTDILAGYGVGLFGLYLGKRVHKKVAGIIEYPKLR